MFSKCWLSHHRNIYQLPTDTNKATRLLLKKINCLTLQTANLKKLLSFILSMTRLNKVRYVLVREYWRRLQGDKHDRKEMQLLSSRHLFSAVPHSIPEGNQPVDKKSLRLTLWDCTLRSIVSFAIYLQSYLSLCLSEFNSSHITGPMFFMQDATQPKVRKWIKTPGNETSLL